MSSSAWTPSASKNIPMVKRGNEERLELVRISLAPEDMKRPCHGHTLVATLPYKDSHSTMDSFLLEMGRPTGNGYTLLAISPCESLVVETTFFSEKECDTPDLCIITMHTILFLL